MSFSYPEPQTNDTTVELAIKLANAMHGKTNNTLTVTLAANAATTTISHPDIGANTALILVPTTTNAAAVVPYQAFPNTVKQQAVLNHANNAQTDRTYRVVLVG